MKQVKNVRTLAQIITCPRHLRPSLTDIHKRKLLPDFLFDKEAARRKETMDEFMAVFYRMDVTYPAVKRNLMRFLCAAVLIITALALAAKEYHSVTCLLFALGVAVHITVSYLVVNTKVFPKDTKDYVDQFERRIKCATSRFELSPSDTLETAKEKAWKALLAMAVGYWGINEAKVRDRANAKVEAQKYLDISCVLGIHPTIEEYGDRCMTISELLSAGEFVTA